MSGRTRAGDDVDIPRDEFNRQLRDLDRAQEAAAKPWQRALERLFDPDEDIDTATKAQVLGVPGRRQFLKFGGATVLGACAGERSAPR